MKLSEYVEFDGLGLAALIRSEQVSAAEVLQAACALIERLNPQLNAVIDRFADGSQRDPHGSESTFAGVPFLIKDLGVSYAGKPSTMGSRMFAGLVAPADSELMIRYRAAGLVTLGKTNLPELGLSYATEPELGGPCRNPWDPTRTPGGSSGGSAAAVAARMVPMAHGNDAGGSIRVPASACGLFGFKPTRARTPTGPFAGETVFGLSVEHALTRSVRDSAALLDATAGEDLGPPYAAPTPSRRFLDEVSTPPGRLRIGMCEQAWGGGSVSPDCSAAVRKAASLCEELGHDVVPANPEIHWAMFRHAFTTLLSIFTAQVVDVFAPRLGITAQPPALESASLVLLARGRQTTGLDLATALSIRDAMARSWGGFFSKFDVLLTPTLAIPPQRVGELNLKQPGLSADEVIDRLFTVTPFTAPFNLTGTPAMSVPLYVAETGLPIGVQFAAAFGADALLFRLAGQLERAAPWAQRKPDCLLKVCEG
jgi:amidase